jgi:hypothetical protein
MITEDLPTQMDHPGMINPQANALLETKED